MLEYVYGWLDPKARGKDERFTELKRLYHRLLLVTGKGGTGKTTLAAAIAQAGRAQGLRVLVAELGRESQLPRLLAPSAGGADYPERELAPGLFAIRIDPFEALAEYLGLELHVPGLVRRVVAHKGFRQLMEASPGWRELIALGKVWHLEQMREAGRPRFDLLVTISYADYLWRWLERAGAEFGIAVEEAA